MKRIVILIVLVTIAAVAGVVRSSVGSVSELRGLVSHHNASDVREEIRRIGPRRVRLYPIYHPAAALYTPRMLEVLREDFHRIPELLALDPPEQPEPEPAPEPIAALAEAEPEREPSQLGLF